MPFPDHYTEAQRQYLVYRSTLISAALNSDASSTSTSPMTSQSVPHADASRLSMTQQMINDPIDTKSILRRQLIIKRKMSAVDSAVGIPNPYTPEVFGMHPNKMLIRSTSEMPYQTGVYHVPLQHSTSFPDATYHNHMLYRGFSSDESYLAQLQSPTTSADYLFEGGYTTLAPVRPHSLTFRPSQRSPAQSNESSSPVNGNSAQRNQNNNTNMGVHFNNQYFANQQSAHSNKGSSQEGSYYHPEASPLSQTTSRSSPPQQAASRQARRLSSVRRSVDGLFRDVNEIIDGEMNQDPSSSTPTCLASSSSTTSNQPVRPPTVAFSENHSPVSRQQSLESSPKQVQLTGDLGNRLPTLYGRWNQKGSSGTDAIQPTNLSMHQVKNESLGSTKRNESPPQSTANNESSFEQRSSISSSTDSVPAYPGSLLSQISHKAQDFRLRTSDKPYQVQYSISSSHPPTMQQYQAAAAAAIYAAAQQNTSVENGLELMKKYGNMSNMVSRLFIFCLIVYFFAKEKKQLSYFSFF